MQILFWAGGALLVVQLVGRFLRVASEAHSGADVLLGTIDPIDG